jgi:dipeptidyl aminopeptidase/acylaminoacyl peptidase
VDERIESAIAHWAPRFTTQGVDMSDFQRATSGLETWDEWLPAWRANGDLHTELAVEAEGHGRLRSAGEAFVRAALSYHFAKFVWMVDMADHDHAEQRAIHSLSNAHRLLDPTAERIEIPLDGMTMAANLRRPPGGVGSTEPPESAGAGSAGAGAGSADPAPLVLLLPGLDSTKEEFFHWEQVFLDRGLATLSLDGPGQGEVAASSHIYPNYEVAVTAALDAIQGRDDVDLDRIGVAGVSLGGYYAPRAAAYEKRIKAAVGIGGPFNFGECWETMPGPTRDTVMHHTGAADLDETRAKASELDLSDAAPLIDQPLLVITGKLDRLIPWEQTKQIADTAPNAEFVMFEEGNHVCNNIPYKYRPLTADWLAEQLSP